MAYVRPVGVRDALCLLVFSEHIPNTGVYVGDIRRLCVRGVGRKVDSQGGGGCGTRNGRSSKKDSGSNRGADQSRRRFKGACFQGPRKEMLAELRAKEDEIKELVSRLPAADAAGPQT